VREQAQIHEDVRLTGDTAKRILAEGTGWRKKGAPTTILWVASCLTGTKLRFLYCLFYSNTWYPQTSHRDGSDSRYTLSSTKFIAHPHYTTHSYYRGTNNTAKPLCPFQWKTFGMSNCNTKGRNNRSDKIYASMFTSAYGPQKLFTFWWPRISLLLH
jgi:hypothetical protein